VWLADLGDETVGFTTPADSGKAKRLKEDTQVKLRPCDMRGNVADDAVTLVGSAKVVDSEALEEVRAAIRAKYGLQARLMNGVAKIRGKAADTRGIVITVDGID
jgi:PPOX class probable F420-dependent enzyme